MRLPGLALALTTVFGAGTALAQPRGGVLQVRLINGTTGQAGSAEKVTLFRLRNEMIPVKQFSGVAGSFEITDIEVEGERPMLLQVTYQGVNYNEPVRFGRGYEAHLDVTVYEAVAGWNPQDFEVTTSRFLYRRQQDRFLVDKVFIVTNRTSPRRTLFDPRGTFRFDLPASDLLALRSVSARGESGMPVPQPAAPSPDGSGYVTKTAFKPGKTELSIAYEVSYSGDSYRSSEVVFYPLPELFVLVSPPDVRIEADGWENLGVEPGGRFATIRRANLRPGNTIAFSLHGGSRDDAVTTPAERRSDVAPHGQVTRIPDRTLASKWFVVVLMAAALGYGLLTALHPPDSRRSPK